jgi:hypothetical protein
MTPERHWILCIGLTTAMIASGCAQNSNLSRSENPVAPPTTQQTKSTIAKRPATPADDAAQKPSKALTIKQSKSQVRAQHKQPAAKPSQPATQPAAVHYPSITLNNPFKLKYGQKRSLPNSELHFKISKVSDNRCPLEMDCIQQGKAVVTLTLYRKDKLIDVLHISANDPAPITSDHLSAYRVQLLELQPYPTVQFIELKHYVAEMLVTKTGIR